MTPYPADTNSRPLTLHPGGQTSARVVLIIRVLFDRRLTGGAHAEHILGPLRDPDAARAEIAELRNAQAENRLADLDWISVWGADIAAAFLDEEPEERRSRG